MSEHTPSPQSVVDWSEYQDDISDAISDSIDMDWNANDGARAVVHWLNENKPLAAAPAPSSLAGGEVAEKANAIMNSLHPEWSKDHGGEAALGWFMDRLAALSPEAPARDWSDMLKNASDQIISDALENGSLYVDLDNECIAWNGPAFAETVVGSLKDCGFHVVPSHHYGVIPPEALTPRHEAPASEGGAVRFQFDTSGSVGEMPGWKKPVPSCKRFMRWEDLNPFTQGYVEGVLRAAEDTLGGFTICGVRFSDLAPEALARTISDCSSFQNIASGLDQKTGVVEGGRFWNGRQGGLSGAFGAAFPPLTVQLGDDGKVRFA